MSSTAPTKKILKQFKCQIFSQKPYVYCKGLVSRIGYRVYCIFNLKRPHAHLLDLRPCIQRSDVQNRTQGQVYFRFFINKKQKSCSATKCATVDPFVPVGQIGVKRIKRKSQAGYRFGRPKQLPSNSSRIFYFSVIAQIICLKQEVEYKL